MTRKIKFIIYFVLIITVGLSLFFDFQGSRFISLFFLVVGYLLSIEIYKFDKFRNPLAYKLENKTQSIFNKQFHIALLLLPLLAIALYGMLFQ